MYVRDNMDCKQIFKQMIEIIVKQRLLLLGLCFFTHLSYAQPCANYSQTDLVLAFQSSTSNVTISNFLSRLGGSSVKFLREGEGNVSVSVNIHLARFNLIKNPMGFTTIEQVHDYLECNDGGINGANLIKLRAVDFNYSLAPAPTAGSASTYDFLNYNPTPNCPEDFLDSSCSITAARNIKICIIDSGIKSGTSFSHMMVKGYDFVNDDSTPEDLTRHGTNVTAIMAGILAPQSQNVKLMALKVLDKHNETTLYRLLEAITYGITKGNNIINLSVSGRMCDTDLCTKVLDEVMRCAERKNVLVVAAAGNDNANVDDGFYLPVSHTSRNLLTVQSSDCSGEKSGFSNYGFENVDVSAVGKGVQLYTNVLGDGTSFSTPQVTGIAAYAALKFANFNVRKIKNLILNNTDDHGLISQTSGVLNANQTLDCSTNNPRVRGKGPQELPLENNLLNVEQLDFETYFSSNDELTISLMSPSDNSAHIRIFRISGQVVKEVAVSLNKGNSEQRIQGLSNFPKGVYLIQVKMEHNFITKKCIKWF